MLEGALAQRFPGVKFVDYRTFGSTHGDEEHEVLADLPGHARRAGGGRDHLRNGVLRQLHARRVAGQRSREAAGVHLLAPCEGFLGQATTTAAGLGLPNLPVAMVPVTSMCRRWTSCAPTCSASPSST